MNWILLAIGIYLLIGLVAALVMMWLDAQAPEHQQWGVELIPCAVVVMLFWAWVLLIKAAERRTEFFDG